MASKELKISTARYVGLAGIRILPVKPVITIEESLGEELAQVLEAHWLFCTSASPIEFVFALDASKLFTPDITVFGARVLGELVSVGAIRKLDTDHAELKSMHTLAKSRGNGISKAIVAHIEDFARAQGFKRISLETGTTEHFKPARGLYKTLGYKECEAFGEYAPSEYSTFMTKMFQ